MDREAVKVIKKFLRKVKKDMSLDKVIFFGSRKSGNYLKHSDIDLVIVSKDFEGIEFSERMRKMYDYWGVDYDVDFLCYTPSEFEILVKMRNVVSVAKKTGMIIS